MAWFRLSKDSEQSMIRCPSRRQCIRRKTSPVQLTYSTALLFANESLPTVIRCAQQILFQSNSGTWNDGFNQRNGISVYSTQMKLSVAYFACFFLFSSRLMWKLSHSLSTSSVPLRSFCRIRWSEGGYSSCYISQAHVFLNTFRLQTQQTSRGILLGRRRKIICDNGFGWNNYRTTQNDTVDWSGSQVRQMSSS